MEHLILPPPIDIISGGKEGLTLGISVHGMWVKDTVAEGITFQILSMSECAQILDPGKPMLPYISKIIAIHPQRQLELSLDSLEFIILDNYYIFPAQYPQTDSVFQDSSFVIDSVIYGQNIFYPETTTGYSLPAIFRDLRVTDVSFFPVFFNPQTRQLKILKKAILRADFTGIDTLNTLPDWPTSVSPLFDAMYESILNYNTLGIQPEPLSTRYQYLIISDASFTDALAPFIFWKTKKGLDIFYETVYQPTPNQIKSLITNYYNNYGVDYVLLIGDTVEVDDPNGQNPIPHIPIYWGWEHHQYLIDGIYSDYWYATIAGIDDIADIALGRFSVWTPEQLTTVINKLFSYERYPDASNWFIKRNELVVWKADERYYLPCKRDSIVPIIDAYGFEYYLDKGSETTDEELIFHINNSGEEKSSSLLNYRGHGDEQGWPDWNYLDEDFSNSAIYQLTNYNGVNSAWLPIVFEICCWCGRVGNPFDTTGHSECWFRHKNGGGVAALGATRPSWTGQNNKFDTELYRVAFGQGVVRPVTQELGWVINKAKIRMAEQYGWDERALDNVRVYHLIGGPEIDIYTGWNGYITATHPIMISTGLQSFSVTVYKPGNIPLQGALVCLYKENDVFEIQISNENGEALFMIAPQTTGALHVTATKHDYGPYKGTCIVEPGKGGPQSAEEDSFIFAFNSAFYNPQTRSVNISYQLPEKSLVEITVYDITGRSVKIIEKGHRNEGYNQNNWDCYDNHGRVVNNGIYFIKLKAANFEKIRKVVIF